MGYRADLQSQLIKTPSIFHIKKTWKWCRNICDAIRDSYELICPVRLQIAPILVLRWNRELSKFRSGESKQLNRAKKTNTLDDWARFEEAQRTYKKATVVAKRDRKTLCERLRVLQRHPAFIDFLAKKPPATLATSSFLMTAIPSR
jgi:hypothetical protein